MRYTKPELILVGSAVRTIQGQPANSKIGAVMDSETSTNPSRHLTAAAYEADE